MKSKNDRQGVIRDIISRERVGSQEELIQLLGKEGLTVAQATLSRDLRELGVTKSHDARGYRFRLPTVAESRETIRISGVKASSGLVISCEFSGNICVLKTLPGHASMLSAMIDGKEPESVAGTLAGDDTVLVVVRAGTDAGDVLEELSGLFPDIKRKLVE